LPWEESEIKRVIDIFECTVMAIEGVDADDKTTMDGDGR
jgi:hypothetical protein